jgi:L-fuculose-phosphate aldolase
MLITPTRAPYERMCEHDLIVVTPGGTPIGTGAPSREWPLHAAVYAARSDVGAIVHTHSVHATAWSFLGEPLEPHLEEYAYYDLGCVRTAPPAAAGSAALADGAVGALGDAKAVLLGGHGVLAVGATVEEAVTAAEVVERHAQILWLLRGERRASRPDAAPTGETHAVVAVERVDDLALAILSDTVLAVRRSHDITRTVVVSADDRVRRIVRDPRVRVVVDDDATTQEVAERIGVAAAVAAGAAKVVVLSGARGAHTRRLMSRCQNPTGDPAEPPGGPGARPAAATG